MARCLLEKSEHIPQVPDTKDQLRSQVLTIGPTLAELPEYGLAIDRRCFRWLGFPDSWDFQGPTSMASHYFIGSGVQREYSMH